MWCRSSRQVCLSFWLLQIAGRAFLPINMSNTKSKAHIPSNVFSLDLTPVVAWKCTLPNPISLEQVLNDHILNYKSKFDDDESNDTPYQPNHKCTYITPNYIKTLISNVKFSLISYNICSITLNDLSFLHIVGCFLEELLVALQCVTALYINE